MELIVPIMHKSYCSWIMHELMLNKVDTYALVALRMDSIKV